MKTFCKIIAFLMVALMMLSAVACGKGDKTKEPNNPSNSASESAGTVDANKPVINEKFDGEKINFFINGGEESLQLRSIVIGENDDPDYEVNAKVQERNDKVENELGVKIVLAGSCGMQEAVERLTPILKSQLPTYDIYGLYQYFDLGLAIGEDTKGSFYNLLNMPSNSYLNVEAPYWNQRLFETLEYSNVAFYITGDLTQTTVGTLFVSFVNATMWDQFKDRIAELPSNPEGYTSVYDLVKNGYWTLDLWMDVSNLCYEDTNHNDTIDYEDRVGVMTYNSQLNNIMTDMLLAGCGWNYTVMDSSGKPVSNIFNTRSVNIATKIHQLLCECKTATIPWIAGETEDDDGLYIMDIFAQGNMLLTVNTLDTAERYLTEMTDDYYVLPLPMYDHAQFDPNSETLGYKSQTGDSVSQFAICKYVDAEKIPAITATMELMGYYSMTMVTPAYYDKALKDRYTRIPEDKEMIDLVHASVYADFGLMWSNRLDNVTWWFRQNYDANSISVELEKLHNNLAAPKAGSLSKLLTALEEAWYLE